ncbi:MAG: hypothetical protein ABIZ80_13200, partial [Bryobacteraceae bacterium]
MKTAGLGTIALAAAGAASASGAPETLVATLYKSLTADQRKTVAFPFDHPLRSKVDNNWFITPARISKFFTPDQQAMIAGIFRGLHNPDFIDRIFHHIQDDGRGLGNYSIALFGEPGT